MIDHLVSYSMTVPAWPRGEVFTIIFLMLIYLITVGVVIG